MFLIIGFICYLTDTIYDEDEVLLALAEQVFVCLFVFLLLLLTAKTFKPTCCTERRHTQSIESFCEYL